MVALITWRLLGRMEICQESLEQWLRTFKCRGISWHSFCRSQMLCVPNFPLPPVQGPSSSSVKVLGWAEGAYFLCCPAFPSAGADLDVVGQWASGVWEGGRGVGGGGGGGGGGVGGGLCPSPGVACMGTA